MKKYGKTGQFNQMVKAMVMEERFIGLNDEGQAMYDKNKLLPSKEVTATVKLHGTNAGVRDNFITDGELSFQSKENVLSIEKDNAGFTFTMSTKIDELKGLMEKVRERAGADAENRDIILFGEFAGGSIQKKVAE